MMRIIGTNWPKAMLCFLASLSIGCSGCGSAAPQPPTLGQAIQRYRDSRGRDTIGLVEAWGRFENSNSLRFDETTTSSKKQEEVVAFEGAKVRILHEPPPAVFHWLHSEAESHSLMGKVGRPHWEGIFESDGILLVQLFGMEEASISWSSSHGREETMDFRTARNYLLDIRQNPPRQLCIFSDMHAN
jgi:hypothetical protein